MHAHGFLQVQSVCCSLLSDTDSGCNKEVAVGDLAAAEVSFESLLKAVAT